MITIKRTDSNDSDFKTLVAALDNDLWSRYGEMQLEYRKYNVIENLPTVVVIYEGNTPVGCGCFKHFEPHTVELKRMFVDPDHRSKGIGFTIIHELEKWARELDHQAMVLETAIGQPEAIHLYRKYGFTDIPRYGQYADKTQSICMKKILN
jgi:putative acetyltransferase